LHNRAPSMTAAHYQSLRQVFAGRVGHKERFRVLIRNYSRTKLVFYGGFEGLGIDR